MLRDLALVKFWGSPSSCVGVVCRCRLLLLSLRRCSLLHPLPKPWRPAPAKRRAAKAAARLRAKRGSPAAKRTGAAPGCATAAKGTRPKASWLGSRLLPKHELAAARGAERAAKASCGRCSPANRTTKAPSGD